MQTVSFWEEQKTPMVSFRRLSEAVPVLSEGWADSLLLLYVGGACMLFTLW